MYVCNTAEGHKPKLAVRLMNGYGFTTSRSCCGVVSDLRYYSAARYTPPTVVQRGEWIEPDVSEGGGGDRYFCDEHEKRNVGKSTCDG